MAGDTSRLSPESGHMPGPRFNLYSQASGQACSPNSDLISWNPD
jgi:hypothetical protein